MSEHSTGSLFDLERGSHRSQFKAIDDATARDHHVHDGGAERPGGYLDFAAKVINTFSNIAVLLPEKLLFVWQSFENILK